MTFNNLPGNIGWEATVQARTYNRISEPDPLRGTVGYGMNGSLFFESTNTTLTATVRDTRPTPWLEGSLTATSASATPTSRAPTATSTSTCRSTTRRPARAWATSIL